jgi:nucleoside-diphosphate-sugar epimerase
MVLGPGDGITQPLADLIRFAPDSRAGKGRVRCQPVDVEDLARCILVSLTDDNLNQQMISVGGPSFLTFRHLVDLIAGQLGVNKPKVLIPSVWSPRSHSCCRPVVRSFCHRGWPSSNRGGGSRHRQTDVRFRAALHCAASGNLSYLT